MQSEPPRSRCTCPRRRSSPGRSAACSRRLRASGGRCARLVGISERSLLMGTIDDSEVLDSHLPEIRLGPASVEVADCDGGAGSRGGVADRGRCDRRVERVGAFFGAGSALLMASLCASGVAARRRARSGDRWPWLAVGFEAGDANGNVSPWTQCAVDCCHRRGDVHPHLGRGVSPWRSTHRHGAAIGRRRLQLVVETLLPIVRDPNTREGRDALNLFDLDPSVTFEPLRLLPGDDTSCLNLYEPRNPRIVAARRVSCARDGLFFKAAWPRLTPSVRIRGCCSRGSSLTARSR